MPVALSVRHLAAALSALAVAGAAVAAAGTSTPTAAEGTATSETTLLSLSVGGQELAVGHLVLRSSRAAGTSAFTALTHNGAAYGEHSLSAGSVAIPSTSSDTVLPGQVSKVVNVRTPGASMSAAAGATRAGFDSLGSVRILGLPLAIDGTLSTTAGVDDGRAGADKTLVVRNLALPSIGGLLGALGLDISKLPSSTLDTLVQRLGIVDAAITTTRAALDAAVGPVRPQLTAAAQQVADARAAVAAAQVDVAARTTTVAAATAALAAATQSLQAALGTPPSLVRAAAVGLPTPSPVALLPSDAPTVPTAPTTPVPTAATTPAPTALPVDLPGPLQTALPTDLPTALPTSLPITLPGTAPSLPAVVPPGVQPAVDAYNAAVAAYAAAVADLNAATGALNLANGLLNTASSIVNTLLSSVQAQVDALVRAITDVLGRTPLVSVDSFTIRTEAFATTAGKGGQTARVVGGEIQGVHVLGADVLALALRTDRIDLGQISGAPLDLVNGAIGTVSATLSSVLSNVPGLPTLSVPAPKIQLLATTTATDIAGGFGRASNRVDALRITIPAITIPAALQMTPVGAPPATLSAKALSAKAVSASAVPASAAPAGAVADVLTQPLVVGVGTMIDTATFKPAAQRASAPPATAPAKDAVTAPTAGAPTAGAPTAGAPTAGAPTGSIPHSPPLAGPRPELPRTGLPAGPALLGLALAAAGLLLARRTKIFAAAPLS